MSLYEQIVEGLKTLGALIVWVVVWVAGILSLVIAGFDSLPWVALMGFVLCVLGVVISGPVWRRIANSGDGSYTHPKDPTGGPLS